MAVEAHDVVAIALLGIAPLAIADQVAILELWESEIERVLLEFALHPVSNGPEIDLGGGDFSFDEAADHAYVSFTIPADVADEIVDPSTTAFQVQWVTSTNADGSVNVSYDGTINNVLGALMHQGITGGSFTDPLLGEVDMVIDSRNSLATFDVNGQPAPGGYGLRLIWTPSTPAP